MRPFVTFCALLLPTLALAQTGTIGESGDTVGPTLLDTIINVLNVVAPIVMGSSIVSMFFKSDGGPVRSAIMRVVDFLALNWLKARNDPAVNQ